MDTVLRYGSESTLRLEVDDRALVADCLAPRGRDAAGTRELVREAIARPLDFPPLTSAATPGDRVVLAIGPEVPQGAAIVGPIVEALLTAGVRPADITLLLDATAQGRDTDYLRRDLPVAVGAGLQIAVHDPTSRDAVAYLAATAAGQPIYLNRLLCDADLVVPIGCLRCGAAPGYHGAAGGLFPTFSDTKTLARYRDPRLARAGAALVETARQEAEEVAWLLGILFSVQVVPGAGDEVVAVLAGNLSSVAQQGQAACDAAWSHSVRQRASLVVAAVEGPPQQQTWENVGRALAAAASVVADQGAIAVCCELTDEPGPAVQKIAGADNPRQTVRRLRQNRPADLIPALQLAEALERAKVYLLSRLDDETVEELGLAPVEDADDIGRLAKRHASCIVLESAQRTIATADEDA
ncbi:MAG: lactate racemase domain-containing protein [Pirellulales bacterium]